MPTFCARRFWLAALLMWALSVNAQQRPTIVFSCWVPPKLPLYQQLEDLYRQAFDALGYDFRMHSRPNERSLMEAASGRTDGECARSPDLHKEMPGTALLRIDRQLGRTAFVAYSHNPDLSLANPEALKKDRYRIGYVRGNAGVTALIQRLELPHTVPLAHVRLGLKMLSAGRLDLFVHTAASTDQALARLELPHPVYQAGELLKIDGYGYLHPQHEHLRKPLARELDRLLSPQGLEIE